MQELTCPRCKHKFEGQVWHNGECPQCANNYIWDEEWAEDYTDCWPIIEWEAYR